MVFFFYCIFLFITLMMKASCGQLFTGKCVKINEEPGSCLHCPLGDGLSAWLELFSAIEWDMKSYTLFLNDEGRWL